MVPSRQTPQRTGQSSSGLVKRPKCPVVKEDRRLSVEKLLREALGAPQQDGVAMPRRRHGSLLKKRKTSGRTGCLDGPALSVSNHLAGVSDGPLSRALCSRDDRRGTSRSWAGHCGIDRCKIPCPPVRCRCMSDERIPFPYCDGSVGRPLIQVVGRATTASAVSCTR